MSFTDIWWILLLMAVFSYLVGSINFSIIISRLKGKDIRQMGSGNPGMMNMSRNYGLKTGVAILLLDMLKGIVPTLVGLLAFKGKILAGTDFILSDATGYMCGFFAVLGHIFPFYLKFKGGKGISTTIGVFVIVSPLVGIISALCGLAFILITNMGAMGSLIAVTPPAIYAEVYLYINYLYIKGIGYVQPSPALAGCIFATVIIVFGIFILTWVAHRRNIHRLIEGEEHQTTWSGMIRKYKQDIRQRRARNKQD